MSGWLSIEDAARRVGKSPDTIYRWIRQGRLKMHDGQVVESHLVTAAARVKQGRPRRDTPIVQR